MLPKEDDAFLLGIPASKTDPFPTGVTVSVPPHHSMVMRRYLRLFPPGRGPLLSLATAGAPRYVKHRVLQILECVLRGIEVAPAGISTHAFQRKAATWAASYGVSDADIKALGRWIGGTFSLYIDHH